MRVFFWPNLVGACKVALAGSEKPGVLNHSNHVLPSGARTNDTEDSGCTMQRRVHTVTSGDPSKPRRVRFRITPGSMKPPSACIAMRGVLFPDAMIGCLPRN